MFIKLYIPQHCFFGGRWGVWEQCSCTLFSSDVSWVLYSFLLGFVRWDGKLGLLLSFSYCFTAE